MSSETEGPLGVGTKQVGHLARGVVISTGQVVVGVVARDGVAPLLGPESISELLQMGLEDIEIEMSRLGTTIPFTALLMLPPIDGAMEVWAAGVTYLASKEARVEESDDREVYRRVYDAERPEIFFKSPPWRVVTDGEPIGIRGDSENNVPEPEVGLVLTAGGELFGFTIVDDVSSRSIEGANPLYLPQAKIFDGCCALGPSIAPRWLVREPSSMEIRMTIRRGSDEIFFGESSTSRMKRSFDELSRHLFLDLVFPEGAVLATGTSVVPPLTTTLVPGDWVEIEVTGLGRLATPVEEPALVGDWLSKRRMDPGIRFSPVRGDEAVAGE